MKKILKGVALFIYCLVIMLLASSCASQCIKTHRYWNKHKCVEYSNPNIIKNERYGYS